jgi:hypothetical protein
LGCQITTYLPHAYGLGKDFNVLYTSYFLEVSNKEKEFRRQRRGAARREDPKCASPSCLSHIVMRKTLRSRHQGLVKLLLYSTTLDFFPLAVPISSFRYFNLASTFLSSFVKVKRVGSSRQRHRSDEGSRRRFTVGQLERG